MRAGRTGSEHCTTQLEPWPAAEQEDGTVARTCTFEDIRELAFHQNHETVSIYLPKPEAGRGRNQNELRLKNHLSSVRKRLDALATPRARTEQILAPLERLLETSSFWRSQREGVALIVDESYLRVYAVPGESAVELERIGSAPHITPLVAAVQDAAEFFVILVSRNDASFARASHDGLERIDLPDVPSGIGGLFVDESRARDLQYHGGRGVVGAPNVTRGASDLIFHAQGQQQSREAARIRHYFREIDRHVSRYLRGSDKPLVFAGDESLFPLYRKVNTYRHLLGDTIPGNPANRSADELLAEARRCVASVTADIRAEAIAAVVGSIGRGAGCTNVADALSAAREGRVATLVTVEGTYAWGKVDSNGVPEIHAERRLESEDLCNLAAIHTIRTGGSVVVVHQSDLPDGVELAASFRYEAGTE